MPGVPRPSCPAAAALPEALVAGADPLEPTGDTPGKRELEGVEDLQHGKRQKATAAAHGELPDISRSAEIHRPATALLARPTVPPADCCKTRVHITVDMLPDDMVTVILLKLDPVTLVKFALTCRTVLRIAKSTVFKQEYSIHHPTALYLGVYGRQFNYLTHRSGNLQDQDMSIDYFSEALGGVDFDILDSADGRLLVAAKGNFSEMYVLNPLSHTYHAIPTLGFCFASLYLHHAAYNGNCGGSFEVLLILSGSIDTAGQVLLATYSSASFWTVRKVGINFKLPPREIICKPTVHINNIYCMLNYGNNIITVDPHNQSVGCINLPEQPEEEAAAPHILARTLQGQLALITVSWSDMIHCWAYINTGWTKIWEWDLPILQDLLTPSLVSFGQKSLVLVVSNGLPAKSGYTIVLCDIGARTTMTLLEPPVIMSNPVVYEMGWPFHLS